MLPALCLIIEASYAESVGIQITTIADEERGMAVARHRLELERLDDAAVRPDLVHVGRFQAVARLGGVDGHLAVVVGGRDNAVVPVDVEPDLNVRAVSVLGKCNHGQDVRKGAVVAIRFRTVVVIAVAVAVAGAVACFPLQHANIVDGHGVLEAADENMVLV